MPGLREIPNLPVSHEHDGIYSAGRRRSSRRSRTSEVHVKTGVPLESVSYLDGPDYIKGCNVTMICE